MSTLIQEPSPAPVSAAEREGLLAEYYFDLFDWLRSNVDLAGLPLKSIGVTTCAAGAGASTVAWNLAVVAAERSDRPVLLADLSRLEKDRASDQATPAGLAAAVRNPGDWVTASGIANLSLLTVGDPRSGQELSVDYGNVGDFLRSLQTDFGMLIVDLPTTESSLCFGAAGSVDGVLFVIEAEETPRDLAERAVRRLSYAHANVLGIILNKCPRHIIE
jgi:Mrp family chromosome partitioning ATPase